MEEHIMYLHQLTQLRIIKLEYEMMALKTMVFKSLAKEQGTDDIEIASKFESLTHVALLGSLESICKSLHLLNENQIKKYLRLDD